MRTTGNFNFLLHLFKHRLSNLPPCERAATVRRWEFASSVCYCRWRMLWVSVWYLRCATCWRPKTHRWFRWHSMGWATYSRWQRTMRIQSALTSKSVVVRALRMHTSVLSEICMRLSFRQHYMPIDVEFSLQNNRWCWKLNLVWNSQCRSYWYF